jgi:DNA helicase-2/ATP-dependent DNA helicase PcrA
MRFIADLHIHSPYSRATSPQLHPESIDLWARIKGIQVVASGDFTHPLWLNELKDKLEPAEPGLFKLKSEYSKKTDGFGSGFSNQPVRFVLTAETSTIYKKSDRVRKIHHLIFAPDFEAAEALQSNLLQAGVNITSDGRPIMGIDSRDLLDMALNVSEKIFFVPAHIWTPWFSVLGSKSGFDSIRDCYEDLADHIYAVETGLSSDPLMNRMCRFLDPYALISNSDAHSPEKLGREANLFDTEFSYDAMLNSLKAAGRQGLSGTIEFFPQEGKYHFDGHKKCGICLDPSQSKKHESSCPVCGKPITIGVLNRVLQLADRSADEARKKCQPYYSLIPLKEILSEITGVGSQSKRVSEEYFTLIGKFGSEFDILMNHPVHEYDNRSNDLLGEAIKRMRNGNIFIDEGYDGQFGRITLFEKNELMTKLS